MSSSADTYLVAGLGNPGRQYRHNRHNIGFMFVDFLAEQAGIRLSRMQMKAITGSGLYAGAKLILAKPQTMMNLSGQAVGSLVRYYRIPLENLFVVYDDLDLPHAVLRMKPAGGSGGHRGLNSIIKELGSDTFPRIRLGIGRPPGRMDPADYVLQDFSEDEWSSMQITLKEAEQCFAETLQQGLQAAMTDCNQRDDDPQ
jgi:PTH1 family peptidyl-tRNA hydrolase